MPASPVFQATLDLFPGNTGLILSGLGDNDVVDVLPEIAVSVQVNKYTRFLPLDISDKLHSLHTHDGPPSFIMASLYTISPGEDRSPYTLRGRGEKGSIRKRNGEALMQPLIKKYHPPRRVCHPPKCQP